MLEYIYLHIGTDKTGSTAIQSCLTDNVELLSNEYGISYYIGIPHGAIGSICTSDKANFIYNSISNASIDSIKIRDELFIGGNEEFIRNLPHNVHTLVYSYEGLYTLDQDSLICIKNYLLRFAKNIRVVLYLRDPYSYALSAISQQVKSGLFLDANSMPPVINYVDVLKRIYAVFDSVEVSVRNFSSFALIGGDILVDFLNVIGVDIEDLSRFQLNSQRSNVSISQYGYLFASKLISKIYNNFKISQDSFYHLYGVHFNKIPGQKLTLTNPQTAMISDYCKDQVFCLKNDFGIEFFSCDPPEFVARQTTLTSISEVIDGISECAVDIMFAHSDIHSEFKSEFFNLVETLPSGPIYVSYGEPIVLTVSYCHSIGCSDLICGVHIFDSRGRLAFGANSLIVNNDTISAGTDVNQFKINLICELPDGEYSIGIAFHDQSHKTPLLILWRNNIYRLLVCAHRNFQTLGYSDLPIRFSHACILRGYNNILSNLNGAINILDAIPDLITQPFNLNFELINLSNMNWVGTVDCPLCVSYHWLSVDREIIVFDNPRVFIPSNIVSTDEAVNLKIQIFPPHVTAECILQIIPLQENVVWFNDIGFEPKEVLTKVHNPN